MTDNEMDYLSSAKSSAADTEDETGLKLLILVAAAVIALATVALLPVVAQVIAFVVVFKWLMAKIYC